jgi:hypothetical protein
MESDSFLDDIVGSSASLRAELDAEAVSEDSDVIILETQPPDDTNFVSVVGNTSSSMPPLENMTLESSSSQQTTATVTIATVPSSTKYKWYFQSNSRNLESECWDCFQLCDHPDKNHKISKAKCAGCAAEYTYHRHVSYSTTGLKDHKKRCEKGLKILYSLF